MMTQIVGEELQAIVDHSRKCERVMFELARHIRNTDELPIERWAVKSMKLLEKVQAIDPARYDEQVK